MKICVCVCGGGGGAWTIHVAEDRAKWLAVVNTVVNLQVS
jgi:hypothetical protein